MLIADDNVDAAQTLAVLLEILGHRVVVAHDGQQALALYDQHHPDFVLLDIGMPVLDGYEVARRLRERAGSATHGPHDRAHGRPRSHGSERR